MRILITSFCLLLAAPGAFAQAPAAAPTIVAERTAVHVRLDADVTSGVDKAGGEVPFTLLDDVYTADHALVARVGAPAYGHVLRSSRRGMLGRSGVPVDRNLDFTCEYLRAEDGTHIPLRAFAEWRYGWANKGTNPASITSLAPVFGLADGRDVVQKGQEYTLSVDRNVALGGATTPVMTVLLPSTRLVFMLTDGTRIIGALASFDGVAYAVTTDHGAVSIRASDLLLVRDPDPVTIKASAVPPSLVVPAPPPPAAFASSALGTHRRVTLLLKGGSSIACTVEGFDGILYTVKAAGGIYQVNAGYIEGGG